MKTYVDASVVLRGLLGERGKRPDWSRLGEGITSAVTRIECQRSLQRHAFRGRITPEFAAPRRVELLRLLRSFDEVALDDRTRAAAGRARARKTTRCGVVSDIACLKNVRFA